MSRREKTYYIIYPPNYDPWAVGDEYKKYRTCKFYHKAIRIAVAMGSGAEIFKNTERRIKPCYFEGEYLPGGTLSSMAFWRYIR